MDILDRASEMIAYFENRKQEDILRKALNTGDLDIVEQAVHQAEALASIENFHAREAL